MPLWARAARAPKDSDFMTSTQASSKPVHDYPPEYFAASKQFYYFGHHKCATNWVRRFLRPLAKQNDINYLLYRGSNASNAFSEKNDRTFHVYVNSFPGDLKQMGETHRGFHLIRDPRDVLISDYYSRRNTHSVNNEFQQALRDELQRLDTESGLLHVLERCPYYDQIAGWEIGADPRVLDVKYEELLGDELAGYGAILEHLGIEIPSKRLEKIVQKCSFESITGRDKGEENVNNHFRKGVAGDWRNYFGDPGPLKEAVYKKIEPIIVALGYEL
jgi:hypothetical protein